MLTIVIARPRLNADTVATPRVNWLSWKADQQHRDGGWQGMIAGHAEQRDLVPWSPWFHLADSDARFRFCARSCASCLFNICVIVTRGIRHGRRYGGGPPVPELFHGSARAPQHPGRDGQCR